MRPEDDQERRDQPRSGLDRPSRPPWIILLLLLAAAGAALWWFRTREGAPTLAPPAPPTPPAVEATPSAPAPAVAAPDPNRVQKLLEAVSPHPLFRRALAEGDVVRRWVVVTDNLAEGVSPRKQLAFLAPAGVFSVASRRGELVIAPASYQRYDAFADAVASVDAQALVKVYRELHPVLEAAYRALGYPGASLDAVTARALRRIEAAPVRDGDVAVKGDRGLFVFADQKLEQLGDVEKHLLRMGPRNTRLLQAKAKELARALAAPSTP
jgi:Protein of unknown function (DUF3014)